MTSVTSFDQRTTAAREAKAERSADARDRFLTEFAINGTRIDLREIIRIIWRRKAAIFGFIFLVMVGTVLVVNQLTPVYTAGAQVMIDPRENRTVDLEAVLSGLSADLQTIEGQIEVLKSRRLAARVIDKLKLYEDPEFNPPPREKAEWRKYLSPKYYFGEDALDWLFPKKTVAPPSPEEELEQQRDAIINEFIGRLDLSPVGRSSVINIVFSSTNPKTAAQAANTLADLYIVDQLEAKYEAAQRANLWLEERLGELRQTVEASEQAVEEYRKRSGLIRGKGTTIAGEQISEISSQLVLARTKRAEAQARLQQTQSLLSRGGNAESAAEVLDSPLIQKLREEEAKLNRRAAELSQEFGVKHPRMVNIRAEIEDQQKKIATEVRKIVQNLRNELAVATVRERELARNLRNLESRVAGLNQSEVQLRALEREARANRTLYENFLGRFKETSEQKGIQQPDARVISNAVVPTTPTKPRKFMLYALMFIISATGGFAIAFGLEALDRGFRSAGQLEATLGVASLGLIPLVEGLRRHTVKPYDYVIDRPTSAFAEAVRSVFTGIQLSDVDNPPKTILVTSSHPNEGKTTLSITLARLLSSHGNKKVVLIDADLRRPQIAKTLGVPSAPGLVEYLAGEVTFEEILHVDPKASVVIIPSGATPASPTDVLASEQMRLLVKQLRETNDLVVIDSPPVLAVSDPRILAGLADKTVFAVRWAETPRETAALGLKQIYDAGADMAGAVLTMVNIKKLARYGYGESGTYYGKYKKYYTS